MHKSYIYSKANASNKSPYTVNNPILYNTNPNILLLFLELLIIGSLSFIPLKLAFNKVSINNKATVSASSNIKLTSPLSQLQVNPKSKNTYHKVCHF